LAISSSKKKDIISKNKKHPNDTGSVKVQIALSTERINNLTEHFKKFKKDTNSRRGLLSLVGRRRKLLKYLKNENPQEYDEVRKNLKLRK